MSSATIRRRASDYLISCTWCRMTGQGIDPAPYLADMAQGDIQAFWGHVAQARRHAGNVQNFRHEVPT